MGLRSLKEKICTKFSQNSYQEEDVIYLLVEIGKYLERSEKDSNDPDEKKLNINEYQIIMFFRNWAVHTEKDRGKIPENILQYFKKVLSGKITGIDEELFALLKNEIKKFHSTMGCNEIKIDWENFHYNLKHILAEQPVKVLCEEKYVGYEKESLNLEEVDTEIK